MLLFFRTILLLSLFFYTSLNANDKVSLQLQWKYQFQFAGYIMAKEKGFYEDENLEVDIREWNHGIDMIEELVKRRTTYAIARPTAFINKYTKKNITFIAAIFQSSPLVLLTDESTGIKSIRDFKNRKLMATKDLETDASLTSMLVSNNIKFNDMQILEQSFNVGDLLNGKTDLIASYISNEPFVLEKMGGKPVVFNPKDYGFEFYNDLLVTNTKYAQNYPQKVRKFKNATLRGWEYAFNNIEETAQTILEKYNTQNKSYEALVYEGKELKKLAINGVDKLGDIQASKIKRVYDIYKLLGLVKADIDFEKLIFDDRYYEVDLANKEKELLQNRTIKVGISPWYPMTYYNSSNNTYNGIGVDIFNLVALRLGLKYEFVADTWANLLTRFKKGEIDLLPTTYFTNERTKYGRFSIPYLNIKEYLYVPKYSSIRGFKDLENKKISVVKSYGAIEKIKKKFPNIEIVEADTLEQTIRMVLNKEVDATFNTEMSISSFLKENYIDGLVPLYQTDFKSSSLLYFVQKDDMHLLDVLRKGLNSISKEEKEKIVSKWLNFDENSLFTNNEKEYIKKNNVVKFCTNTNWTPIEFITKTGKPNGISIDTLKLISEKTGLKFEHVKTKNWKQSQEFLRDKKCDILPSAVKTSKREKYANFTKPYLNYDLAIITTKDKPLVNNLESIIDKKMSRKATSGLITKLKDKYPDIDIVPTPGYKESFEAVSNGDVYFTIATLPILSYYKNVYGLDNLQIAGYTKMKYNLRIVVRDDKEILVNILDKALDTVSNESKNLIYEKWSSKSIESEINYDQVQKILLLALVILAFFAYKQYVLNRSIKDFEELIDATMEGIFLFRDGVCVDVNRSALNILGYENKKEVVGKSPFIFVAPESRAIVKAKMSLTNAPDYEAFLVKKDGTRIHALLHGYDLKNRKVRVSSFIDISVVKQQEEQIVQQAKLVSMGEMIGNIAHQWRQPLSVISTSATGIKVQKEYDMLTDEFLLKACDNIDNNVQYLSKTIDDFRDFIKGDRKKAQFSAQNLLDSFINLIEASAKINNIKIVVNIEDDLKIDGYQNELNQCFMNIYNNAKDVLLEKIDKDQNRYIFIDVFKNNQGKVDIVFKDNGGGIPEDILPKIFEPYFTTKHQSNGTGLGLNMTYNLITQGMQGDIKAQNITYSYNDIKYKGAMFIITL